MISLLSRLLILSIYPLLIYYFFNIIFQNKKLKESFSKNKIYIFINTLTVTFIGILALYCFFKIEKTYYSYDYVGQWKRALEIKELFFGEKPYLIFKELYISMNYKEYSYLPAVFILPLLLFTEVTYMWYNISIFLMFLVPVLILLQIIYFDYFEYKYLPIGIFASFFPFFFTIFNGEPDIFSMFFIIFTCYVLFIKDVDKITRQEIYAINVSTFILLFFRRYQLFYVIFMYVVYLLRIVLFYIQNKEKVDVKKLAIQTIETGIYALVVIVLFFTPFFIRTITNNFSSSYAMFDNDKNKFLLLIESYSYVISLISLIGFIISIKNNKRSVILISLNAALICLLFWRIQIFEQHHYTLISIQILILFVIGLSSIVRKNKILATILIALMTFQSANIFLDKVDNKLLVEIRRTPQVRDTIELMTEITDYLNDVTGDDKYVWFATGNVFFDSQICNVVLPDLDRMPNIVDNNVLDIRDRFPDLNKIDYIVISEPTLYLNEDYQKMYDVIHYAINFEPEVAKHFTFDNEWFFGSYYIEVVKRVDDLDIKAKNVLYELMVGYYPELSDDFLYMLD